MLMDPRRFSNPMGTLVVGQRVRVDLGQRGGVQAGTVTRLLPDGRFEWKNRCNYIRTAHPKQLTGARERAGKLDPYVQAWVDEPGDDE